MAVIVLLASLVVRGDTGVGVALVAGVLLLAIVPIFVSAWIRRLEVRDGELIVVRAISRLQSPIRDIAAVRLYRIGNGLSRCTFVRGNGTVFGTARGVWRTEDLLRMANEMGVRIDDSNAVAADK